MKPYDQTADCKKLAELLKTDEKEFDRFYLQLIKEWEARHPHRYKRIVCPYKTKRGENENG